ncbi:hypothetical protein NQZ79_g2755 [Umbelopsis isabellina]|nr:hypothetical protein NQZ79_g2755 [Umbelopsis isabellina]
MSTVATRPKGAAASTSSLRQPPDFVTPPILSEPHAWYGSEHQQPLHSIFSRHCESLLASNDTTSDSAITEMNLFDAAMSGNLQSLTTLLETQAPDTIQSSTGLSPLHFASSRGHIEIVKHLLDIAGASVDIVDREGETPLLKAAYHGHKDIVSFLIEDHDAATSHQDHDGWTALHNACSQAHLDIASYLLDQQLNIDIASKMGHTPLINAAAKGNVAIVKYLLENDANPLIKNKFGETAFDAAAASAYPYICEILEQFEKAWWTGTRRKTNGAVADVVDITENHDYNPLSFHITVPVIIHENQRAVSNFSLAGLVKPTFAPSALKKDELVWSTYPDNEPTRKQLVQLPPIQQNSNQSAWFWMSDWHIDKLHPLVDKSMGWQYSKSFDAPDELWSPNRPKSGVSWVRRRRWFRVMKKRIKIEGEIPTDTVLQDYLMRAESIFGALEEEDTADLDREWRIRIYNQGLRTLIDGIKVDQSSERRRIALQLMKTYIDSAEELGYTFDDVTDIRENIQDMTADLQRRQVAHQAILATFTTSATTTTNIPTPEESPIPTFVSTYSNSPNSSLQVASTSLLETLSQSQGSEIIHGRDPRFYIDRESVSSVTQRQLPSRTSSFQSIASNTSNRSPNVWEKNENAMDCRRCGRYFSLLVRRHHCRICGLVVCDRCSMNRSLIPAEQFVHDPSTPAEQKALMIALPQRTCDKCNQDLHHPRSRQSISSGNVTPSLRRSMSGQSVMNECPVCGRRLSSVGASKGDQELHVQSCLNGENPVLPRLKYILYRLQGDSSLIGQECTICFENFVEARQNVADQAAVGLTPTQDQKIILIIIGVYIAAILILWNMPIAKIILSPFKLLTVGLHEFSHAIVGCCTCAKIDSIEIDPDEGGVTRMRGGIQACTLPAGYLGSSLIGAILVMCGFNILASKIASIFLGVCLLFTLWWAKNWLTRAIGIIFIGLIIFLWWLAHGAGLKYFVLFIGVMSSLYCLWDILDDLVFRKAYESDASKFAKVCGGGCMSSRAWGVIWFFISLIFLVCGILIGLAAFKGELN